MSAESSLEWNFGDLPPALRSREKSHYGIIPVPYERTTSYGQGTSGGPAAIVQASRFLELFDEVYGFQPADEGIWTAEPISFPGETIAGQLHHIYTKSAELLAMGKFLIFAGGEHSITYPLVRAYREKYPGLSVLQIDAHADLRAEYEGSPFSHACAMRRVLELCPAVQVGVRSLSAEEYQAIPSLPTEVIFAHDLYRDRKGSVEKMLAKLTDTVYITFDLDGLDPSCLPATGTPEPGGLAWTEALDLLEQVFRWKNVVGGDVVELAPIPGWPASDFLAAKLVYKMIGMKQYFSRNHKPTVGG